LSAWSLATPSPSVAISAGVLLTRIGLLGHVSGGLHLVPAAPAWPSWAVWNVWVLLLIEILR